MATTAQPAADLGPPRSRHWLRIGGALTGLLFLVALARYWPPSPEALEAITLSRWDELPNLQPHGHILEDPQILHVQLQDRFLIFGNWPERAVRSVELEVQPLTPGPLEGVLLLYIEAASNWIAGLDSGAIKPTEPDLFPPLSDCDGQIRTRVQHAVVHWKGANAILRWHLREPAVWFKLAWPGEARLRLASIRVVLENRTQSQGLRRWMPLAAKVLAVGCAGWLTLVLLGQFWPALLRINYKRTLIWVQCVILILLALLLPPFQGPDENLHWAAAINMYRSAETVSAPADSGIEAKPRREAKEKVLLQLPELLDALTPRWRSDVPFHPDIFHRPAQELDLPEADSVGYAGRLTYPIVGLVATFFPTVSTLPEALCFYYLCRLLPIPFWLGLLLYAERRGWLTYTLLTFLSLPLWLEQAVVVSSDTVTLLAAFAAGLLFLSCRKDGGWKPVVALWLVAITAFLAKQYGALMLLPVFVLPWRKVPAKWLTIPIGLVASVFLGWLALQMGIRMLEQSKPDARGKLSGRLERVIDGRSTRVFLEQVTNRFTYNVSDAAREWYQPLGWLDTPLSGWHHALIAVALLIALLADASERGASWLQAILQHPGELLLLWGLVIVHAAVLVLTISLIMFITFTATEDRETTLYAVQIRYFFPTVIIACLVPQGIRASKLVSSGPPVPAFLGALFPSLLLVLAATRAAATAIDLLARYFS